MNFENTAIVTEARKARFKPHPLLQILIFIVIFIITNIIASVPIAVIMLLNKTTEIEPNIFSDLISLFTLIIPIALIIIYCKYIEKRSLYSMGFVKNGAIKNYFKGLFIGFAMFSAAVLICMATNSISFVQFNSHVNLLLLAAFFIGFLIQGAEEEVFMRGYFMMSLSTRLPVVAAILINSLVFALLHLFNDGINALSVINIMLVGIFFSIYMLKTNNIWGACAMHSMWNFVQGNFFGLAVSGNNFNISVFKAFSFEDKNIINGGEFGPEGGIAVTFVIAVSIILIFVMQRNKKIA